MFHFTCFVVVPCDKPSIEVSEQEAEQLINEPLAPYNEHITVDAHDVKCYCVGKIATRRANLIADAKVGTIESFRKQFWSLPEDNRTDDAWKQALAPYIEAQEIAFNTDPDRENPDPECTDCNGSGFRSTTYNPLSQWDWYVVGGRWNAIFTPSYKPELDSRNIENCDLCNGTGKRNDELGRKHRKEDPSYTCNGCNGEGKRLKWHNQWIHPVGANISNPKAVLKMIKSDEDVIPFAMVTPNEGWVEKAKMGWWAMTSNEKEPEVWKSSVINLLEKYSEGHIVINVDCHI